MKSLGGLPMKKMLTATRIFLYGITISCTLLITGCTSSSEKESLQNLNFTVVAEEKIPEKIKDIIKKEAPFQITYTDNVNLYICIGYGEQETGGYSIAVNGLYLSSDSQNIMVNTALLEPEDAEKTGITFLLSNERIISLERKIN